MNGGVGDANGGVKTKDIRIKIAYYMNINNGEGDANGDEMRMTDAGDDNDG